MVSYQQTPVWYITKDILELVSWIVFKDLLKLESNLVKNSIHQWHANVSSESKNNKQKYNLMIK